MSSAFIPGIADLDALFVRARVQRALDFQAGLGCRRCDQLDDSALTGLRKRGYAVGIDRADKVRGSVYRIEPTEMEADSAAPHAEASQTCEAPPDRPGRAANLRTGRGVISSGRSRWVAKLCRNVCGDTRLAIPAACAAAWTARASWRTDIGLTGFWPGNSQACGRAAHHQSRNSSSSCGESMT